MLLKVQLKSTEILLHTFLEKIQSIINVFCLTDDIYQFIALFEKKYI